MTKLSGDISFCRKNDGSEMSRGFSSAGLAIRQSSKILAGGRDFLWFSFCTLLTGRWHRPGWRDPFCFHSPRLRGPSPSLQGEKCPWRSILGKLPPGSGRPGAVASVAGKPTHPKPRTQNDVGKSTGASQAVSQAVLFRHFSGRFARPLTPEKLDMDGFWKLEIAIY